MNYLNLLLIKLIGAFELISQRPELSLLWNAKTNILPFQLSPGSPQEANRKFQVQI